MRNLSNFRGSSRSNSQFLVFALSFLAYKLLGNFLFSSNIRVVFFRILGAKIGKNVKIRSKIRVYNFKNLEIGDQCWIGEEVWFINHEKIKIGSNVCVSQRSIVCSGGHDYRTSSLAYAHKPIEIKDGAWICLDAKLLPGVTIGECSVVSAGEVARKSVPDYSILIGGEIRQINSPK